MISLITLSTHAISSLGQNDPTNTNNGNMTFRYIQYMTRKYVITVIM